MKYFTFKNSLNEKLIGKGALPQAAGIYEHNAENPAYIFNAFSYYEKVHGNVLIPKARIRNKSTKITDLLSAWSSGFSGKLLISDKLKTILEASKQIGFQFLPTTVYDFSGQHAYPYWLMNVYIFFPEYIDYAASEIVVASIDGKSKEPVSVNSYEAFCEKEKLYAPRDFQIKKLALLNDIIENDFFAVDKTSSVVTYIVSEKLKSLMEIAGCTGIDYLEI